MHKDVVNNYLKACGIGLLACAIIFPEIILTGKISFLMWSDHIVDYFETFALTSFFYQGGLQLWDFFGQLPHTYSWLSFGMFKVQNVMTALAYFILSPLALDSAQFFHSVYGFVSILCLLLINITGIYLLLRRLTHHKYILIIASPIYALLFTLYAFVSGLLFLHVLPLIMYFILCFFETYRSRYAMAALGLLLVSLHQQLIHTFYIHLVINFFVISTFTWSMMCHRPKAIQWLKDLKKPNKKLPIIVLWSLILSVVILAPYAHLQLSSFKDIEVGMSSSRFQNIFNIGHYFNGLNLALGDYKNFFRSMLDFTFITGETTKYCAHFLGYMMFFLSAIALTCSKNNKKWIFFAVIIMLWLLNFPREHFNLGTLVHWINVLTNPSKSIVRTYEVATIGAAPYFFIPLAVLGIEALVAIFQKQITVSNKRIAIAAILISIFSLTSLPSLPLIVQYYIITALVLSLLALFFITQKTNNLFRGTALVFFVILALMDIAFAAFQTKEYLHTYCTVRPHHINYIGKPGFMHIDYQNPKVFPFIERFDFNPERDNPQLWSVYDVSPSYTKAINMDLAFSEHDGHRPRHVAYRTWKDQPFMAEYVQQNDRLFSFARAGVQNSPGMLEKIIASGLARDVAAIDASGEGILPNIPGINPSNPSEDNWTPQVTPIQDYYQKFTYQNNLVIWQFPLSQPLPKHTATTAFSKDKSVRLIIQFADKKVVELAPAQGGLISPWTFDAQNMREGRVFAALPMDVPSLNDAKGILLLKDKPSYGVQSVWRHQSDQTGIIYKAPDNGWLVIHYPYDKKWKITIDKKTTSFYRANNGFMAVPISAGDHKILIQYWPGMWVRWGLVVSTIAALALFFGLIVFAFREESSRR